MNMQNLNWSISNKLMRLNSYITTERLVKKLKIILLAILVLAPTLASAKMIKTPEGDFINENSIYLITQKDKDTCEVYFEQRNSAKKYLILGNCEAYVEKEKLAK